MKLHNLPHGFRLTRFGITAVACIIFAVLITSCISDSASGIPRRDVEGGRLELRDLALSPDGHTVSFQYSDREKRTGGIGLLDWRTGLLRKNTVRGSRITFSPDGKYLVGSTPAQIGSAVEKIFLVDTATFETKPLADAHPDQGLNGGVQQIAFEPETSRVLYETGYPHHLILLDPVNHTEQEVLDKKHGFYSISAVSFVDRGEIVFSAMTPEDPRLKAGLDSLNVHLIAGATRYRLKFGGDPEFTMPEIVQHSLSVQDPWGIKALGSSVPNVVTSSDGKRTVFIDISSTEPKNPSLQYNYEIFLLEDGKVEQLTNLKSHLQCLAISADGSTVAFGSDPNRIHTHDLMILDVRTRVVTPMLLAQRFEKSPEFNQ